jgi:protein-S-isoprenylcysteine O-methyltransferase Ste14
MGYLASKGIYLDAASRWFRLPRWLSMSFASFSFFYEIFLLVLYCLPPTTPVTANTMNWTVIFGVIGILFFSGAWTFRKDFVISSENPFDEVIVIEANITPPVTPIVDHGGTVKQGP